MQDFTPINPSPPAAELPLHKGAFGFASFLLIERTEIGL